MELDLDKFRESLEALCATKGIQLGTSWSIRIVLTPPVLSPGHGELRRALLIGEKEDGTLHRLGSVTL